MNYFIKLWGEINRNHQRIEILLTVSMLNLPILFLLWRNYHYKQESIITQKPTT